VNLRIAFLVGALAASPASAQSSTVKTFDLEQVMLTPGGQHSLLLSTGDTLSQGNLRLFLAAQYQHDPLVLMVEGQRQGSVVGHRIGSYLGVAYGINDSIEVALQVPVILRQWGDLSSFPDFAPVAGTAFGSPMLQGRFVLARQSASALGDVGLNLGGALPFGSSSGLAHDPGAGLSLNASVGVGRDVDVGTRLRVGGEAGVVVRQSERLSSYSQRVIDEVGTYATLGLSASTLGEGLRGELSGRVLVPFTQTSAAVQLLAGARYPLPSNLELFALAGPGFGRLPGNPSFRAFVGMTFSPLGASRAKKAPEGTPGPPAPVEPRCPPPPPQAECPACPTCPAPAPPAPEVAKKEPCPAGNEGAKKAVLTATRIEIKEQVLFATGKADILAPSFPLLEEVAGILKAHPEITRLRIDGHTDNRGPHEYNVALSQSRSEAVLRFLVERGVAAERLEAKGFGPDQPVADNASEEGRQKNRRVEFIAVEYAPASVPPSPEDPCN
jgi:outer membrane protein OmpA-like peptidoglycan-associated protein